MNENQSVKTFEKAVEAFASLPGVGKKTATRYVLYLLRHGKEKLIDFSKNVEELGLQLQFCKQCFNLSEGELCKICNNNGRIKDTICVVEDIKDLMAIEKTGQYRGLYHVLGGLISPMDGIGPSNLHIESLLERVEKNKIEEIILALSTTSEGDTTAFYIYRKLENSNCKVSIIARGIGVGNDLEYIDELTLGSSIVSRLPYQNSFS